MKPLRHLLLGTALLGAGLTWAAGASAPAFGAADYVWNAVTPEQAAAMKLSGDVERGREAYRGCRGCHRADGEGRSDGSYPRLSGQHAAVLVKEVTDTRAGVRRNPKMDPFSSQHAVSLQEIVDIAEFLSRAVAGSPNGRGEAALAAAGARLYHDRGCDECHGVDGAGQATKLYPLVAGQHYAYLLREMQLVQAGQRGPRTPTWCARCVGWRCRTCRRWPATCRCCRPRARRPADPQRALGARPPACCAGAETAAQAWKSALIQRCGHACAPGESEASHRVDRRVWREAIWTCSRFNCSRRCTSASWSTPPTPASCSATRGRPSCWA